MNEPKPAASESAPAVAPKPPGWRRILPLGLLILAMGLAYGADLHRHLNLEAVVEHRQALRDHVEANRIVALAAFSALYAATVALSLSSTLSRRIRSAVSVTISLRRSQRWEPSR